MQEAQQNKLRVALYARVSTEEQREGQTIESQIKELERFASDKHWTLAGVYKDEGWSGKILARPEVDRLRDDASKSRFDVVLINDVDRLARDVTQLGIIRHDLEQRGVRVIFRKLPDEQSPAQNLMVNVLGSFAEFERELIADRTRRGRRHKVEVRQQFLGCIPPYGFRYISKAHTPSEMGSLEIEPEEAAVVRMMYKWVDEEGLSARKVRDRLNQRGLRPRKNGSSWQKSSVLRILRSEVYAGVWYYNKHRQSEPIKPKREHRYRRIPKSSSRIRPRKDWLPVRLTDNLRIVEPGRWQRAQEQLTRNSAFSPRNSRHLYLLGGLVRCGGCNARYVGNPSHGSFSYRCANRCKTYASISERSLDSIVWNTVKQALMNPDVIVDAATEIREHNKAEMSSGSDEQELKRGLDQLHTEERRIVEAYRQGILNTEQLAKELEGIKARRELLESQKQTAGLEMKQSVKSLRRSLKGFCADAAKQLSTVNREGQRQVLRLIVQGVIFEGRRVRIQGIIPIGDRVGPCAHPSDLGNGDNKSVGSIATTTPYLGGPNTALASDPVRQPGEVLFELIRKVEHDNTARIAASRANLVKAMAGRWPKTTKLESAGKGGDPAARAQ